MFMSATVFPSWTVQMMTMKILSMPPARCTSCLDSAQRYLSSIDKKATLYVDQWCVHDGWENFPHSILDHTHWIKVGVIPSIRCQHIAVTQTASAVFLNTDFFERAAPSSGWFSTEQTNRCWLVFKLCAAELTGHLDNLFF